VGRRRDGVNSPGAALFVRAGSAGVGRRRAGQTPVILEEIRLAFVVRRRSGAGWRAGVHGRIMKAIAPLGGIQ